MAAATVVRIQFVLLALAVAAPATIARGADVRPNVVALFDAGTKNIPPAVAAARQRYEGLKRVHPKDSRIDYAYGLVLVNQHKYADAIAFLSRYVDQHEDDVVATRVLMWAQLQEKRSDELFEAVANLCSRFPDADAAQPQAEWLATAEFLGAIFGYLELVRPSATDWKRWTPLKDDLLRRLGSGCLPSFDRGRERVANELAELTANRAAKQQQTALAAEALKKESKDLLKDSQEKAATERDAAQASTGQLNDAARELDLVQRQFNSLSTDRARLSALMITLQAQITDLQAAIVTTLPARPGATSNRLWSPTPRPGDIRVGTGNSVSQTNIDAERFLQLSAASFAFAQLNKQAFDLDRRMLDLRTRGLQLGGLSEKEARTKAESEASAAKAAKQAKLLERKLNNTKTPAAPRSTAPTGRMAMFSTYVPFPYEEEKERVLSWFTR